MSLRNTARLSGIAASAAFCAASLADVKLPALFSDHMVLQKSEKVPIWGKAEPREDVAVTLGQQSEKTRAGEDGNWRLDLNLKDEGAGPYQLVVQGRNTLTVADVLVGEVWVASGQSNMAFTLARAHNAETEIPKAADPQMRLFLVAQRAALEPQADVTGKWVACTPATAARFSAVAYFFARNLRAELRQPVGIIGTYWGGTRAEAWTSLSGIEKDSALQHYVAAFEKVKADYPEANQAYPALLAEYRKQLAKWNEEVLPVYKPLYEKWREDVGKARTAGQLPPPRPEPSRPAPKAPLPPVRQNDPSVLYNGMIAPLIPYAVRGVIWYQGEGNENMSVEYRTLFPRMITDWREKWGEGSFPFLFVQLPNYRYVVRGGDRALLREAQSKTLALPNTGMAVTVDIGNPIDNHPQDKIDVGWRLALAARHVAYGQQIVYSGPVFDAMKVEGNQVVLSFKHVGGGLIIGAAPWVAPGAKPVPTTELVGFAVAGADKQWAPANARIEKDSVVASSPQVENPVAVRYGWDNNPTCNLYNREGLPAVPFRTDDWE